MKPKSGMDDPSRTGQSRSERISCEGTHAIVANTLYTCEYSQPDDFAGSLAMSLLRHHHSPSRRLIVVLLILLLGISSNLAVAEPRRDNARPHQSQEERPRARISASQAAAIVQQRYGGKVMNVSTRQTNNGVVYGVKILQNSGHMRTVNVDGQSGAILN